MEAGQADLDFQTSGFDVGTWKWLRKGSDGFGFMVDALQYGAMWQAVGPLRGRLFV